MGAEECTQCGDPYELREECPERMSPHAFFWYHTQAKNMRSPKYFLEKHKASFRVLKDWEITYDRLPPYENQCTTHPVENRCTIYKCTLHHVEMDAYFLHEILHAAFEAALRGGKEAEELLVQDLVVLLKGKKS